MEARGDKLALLAGEVAVGHAGDVVADAEFESIFPDSGGGFTSEFGGVADEEIEEFRDEFRGLAIDTCDVGMVVEIGEEEATEGGEFLSGGWRECGQSFVLAADIVERGNAGFSDIGSRLADEVIDEEIHEATDDKPAISGGIDLREFRAGFFFGPGPQRHGGQRIDGEQPRIETIIEIVAGIGNLIAQVSDLRFERWRGIGLSGEGVGVALGVTTEVSL